MKKMIVLLVLILSSVVYATNLTDILSSLGGGGLSLVSLPTDTLITKAYNGRLISNIGATGDVNYTLDTRANLGSAFNCAFVNETGITGFDTSYTNPKGSGNRTSTVVFTTTFGTDSTTSIIDGAKSWSPNITATSDIAGLYFQFDFGAGTRMHISEFTWFADGNVLNAPTSVWKCQYSNNGTTWTDVAITNWNVSNEEVNDVLGAIATLTPHFYMYRYFRITGVSGSIPGQHSCEVEFKISVDGTYVGNKLTITPATGEQLPSTGAVNHKLVSNVPSDFLPLRTTTARWIGLGAYPVTGNWVDTP